MRPFVLLPVLLAVALVPSARATPVDDVLHLVPPNTAVCFVVRDLRGHSVQLAESPFADWFRQSEFGKAVLKSDGVTKLVATEKAITAHLGVSIEDLRNDVFGDVVVLAYQPGTGANGSGESGALILKARKPDALADLVRKFNDAQKASGELKEVREKRHLELPYFEREKADGNKEFYFTRDDGVFAFSAQETAIQRVLFMDDRVRLRDGLPKRVFTGLPKTLGTESAVVQVLFNPRSLDAELAAKAKETKDPNEKAFLAQFGKVWAATNGVGLALTLDRTAELAVHLAFDADRLPAEWKPLLEPNAGSTALWSVIPNEALFAVAGRFDLTKAADGLKAMMSDEAIAGAKKTTAETVAPILGRDTLPKLMAGLGPDWGLWLTRPDKSDSVLPTATFALRVRKAGSTDTSVGDSLTSGLDTVGHLLKVAYNKDHDDEFTFADEKTDSGVVKALKNPTALPAGVSPAYGLRGDFLVLASHPNGVIGFTPPKADAKVDSAPLVRVSVKTLTSYLKEKGADLGKVIGGWTGEKPETVTKNLRDLATVLEMGDRLELHHTSDGNRMKLSLQIEAIRPLKK
jgi:hypothetical protein